MPQKAYYIWFKEMTTKKILIDFDFLDMDL